MHRTILLALLAPLAVGQTIATYRVQNRPAAEMVSVAEAALGGDGTVVLDERTSTLILNGTGSAVARALDLLEQMDRPLRSVVVTHEIREWSELEGLSADVRWNVGSGSFRVGTIPRPLEGIRAALSAGTESRTRRSRARLRLLEGGSGFLVTGDALPFVYEPYFGAAGVSFVHAETGFEVDVAIAGDPGWERVQLELRPFSGRFEGDGRIRYTAASTSLSVSPGETAVIAESSSEQADRSADLQGIGASASREERVLLVSVTIERP